MYKTILVPLDGSKFSESALGHASAVAQGCQAEKVVLFRAVEPIIVDVKDYIGADKARETEQKREADAQNYLDSIAVDLKKQGIPVETELVVDGEPAEKIVEYIKNKKVDLVIMSTHGRTGFKQWVFGSVAHKVLVHSSVPILMVVPKGRE
ncbi:MAG: universal stress protein [Spirochaetota bacterium]